MFRADFGCDAKSAAKILAEVSKGCPELVSCSCPVTLMSYFARNTTVEYFAEVYVDEAEHRHGVRQVLGALRQCVPHVVVSDVYREMDFSSHENLPLGCFSLLTDLRCPVLCQTSLMLFTADENADRYLCCGLIPNSKATKKDTNKWVQVR